MSIFLENRRVFLTTEALKHAENSPAQAENPANSLPKVLEQVATAKMNCKFWENHLGKYETPVAQSNIPLINHDHAVLHAFKDYPTVLANLLSQHNPNPSLMPSLA